jgi:hypothetical protein
MGHSILIETPFASATQTAKILGVSKSRKKQLAEMLNFKKFRSKDSVHVFVTGSTKKDNATNGATWRVASKRAGKSRKVNTKRRLLSKGHASKKTRS